MSLFLYGLEVWASAYQHKYLDLSDIFFGDPIIIIIIKPILHWIRQVGEAKSLRILKA